MGHKNEQEEKKRGWRISRHQAHEFSSPPRALYVTAIGTALFIVVWFDAVPKQVSLRHLANFPGKVEL